MKSKIHSWTAWILVRIRFMTANFDFEVLQWPGGSVIAFALSLYVTVRAFWSDGLDGSANRQEAAQCI